MPDRKHALMEPVKPSTFGRTLHGPVSEAKAPQLPNRNDTVLSAGQQGELLSPR